MPHVIGLLQPVTNHECDQKQQHEPNSDRHANQFAHCRLHVSPAEGGYTGTLYLHTRPHRGSGRAGEPPLTAAPPRLCPLARPLNTIGCSAQELSPARPAERVAMSTQRPAGSLPDQLQHSQVTEQSPTPPVLVRAEQKAVFRVGLVRPERVGPQDLHAS
jgi:hypothetical protein